MGYITRTPIFGNAHVSPMPRFLPGHLPDDAQGATTRLGLGFTVYGLRFGKSPPAPQYMERTVSEHEIVGKLVSPVVKVPQSQSRKSLCVGRLADLNVGGGGGGGGQP